MKWTYNREDKSKRRVCHCDNPCTTSSCGRMIYVYPGFCVANRKTSNEKTIHADLLLAGVSQLLTVVVADKINQRNHIRSLKSYIA